MYEFETVFWTVFWVSVVVGSVVHLVGEREQRRIERALNRRIERANAALDDLIVELDQVRRDGGFYDQVDAYYYAEEQDLRRFVAERRDDPEPEARGQDAWKLYQAQRRAERGVPEPPPRWRFVQNRAAELNRERAAKSPDAADPSESN